MYQEILKDYKHHRQLYNKELLKWFLKHFIVL